MAYKRRSLGTGSLHDPELLAAALVGYEQQRSEIETRITEIQRQLGGRAEHNGHVGMPSAETAPARKRTMSASARKRISDATKKRWAAFRAKKANKSA